jgi:hypothetical protein
MPNCAEFLPYWEECLDERSAIGGEMNKLTVLFTACTGLGSRRCIGRGVHLNPARAMEAF